MASSSSSSHNSDDSDSRLGFPALEGADFPQPELLGGQGSCFLVALEATFSRYRGRLVAPEPYPGSADQWKKRVFLPFMVDTKLYSFLGPIASPQEADVVADFPSNHLPLMFGKRNIDASYWSRRIFRTSPPKESAPLFRQWMERLTPKYGDLWNSLGITQALH
ncbi:hypothetical protein PIB30_008355 [Stylosanthes scabra]|uniref:Uncharacterized protein n=1 Tax=Stylosanthes scabra TaxID=79078 RepID=A0ABU6T4U2_9FABA|nr:hypothetical protein [Stylosanthes scabra]